jgi:hypothetical protein
MCGVALAGMLLVKQSTVFLLPTLFLYALLYELAVHGEEDGGRDVQISHCLHLLANGSGARRW